MAILRRRHRSDRGTALVEAAISTVVFSSILFGVVEFGLAFKDYLSMSSAVRSGARVASAMGTTANTDYLILQEVLRRMTAVNRSQITDVVVFKGTSSTSTLASVNSTCQTTSVSSVCNHYSNSSLSLASSAFTGLTGAPDAAWPPVTRKDKLSGPPDYIGVWVKISHQGITGMFGLTDSYTDEVMMRIEPATVS